MHELINLAKIVTNRRLTTLPLVDFADSRTAKSREEQLLELLVSGESLTNLQVAKRMYNSSTAKSQAALRKLKQRLQEKLLNHLFFLDHTDPRHPAFRRYEQQCLDLLYQATMLWRESERVLLPQVLRKVVRLATSGEFTQQAISAWEMLRTLYAESNDYTQYQNSVKQLNKLYDTLTVEREAQRINWDAKMKLVRSVSARRRLLQELPDIICKLEGLYQQVPTYNVYDPLLKMRLMQQELSGNFEEIIRITTAAEKLFAQGKLNPKRFDSRFTKFYSMYAHLRARRITEGLALAEGYLEAFHRSNNNWFAFLELYYLLAMHDGDYVRAGELLRRMQQNPFVTKIPLPAQQRWELMQAYLFFVRPEEARLRPLHFAQLVQRIPDHSRDKQGYNVAILILQFLHYLREGNQEALLARLEGLRKYEKAHLREASTLRSRLMFRLLQLTVKEDFDPEACEKKGQALLARLRDTPPPGEAFAEIEIIPYENLWSQTLGLLREPTAQRVS
ncbi:hypothetical protein [Solirubrum puertoriconensis]|uniref:Uncharacterized protein n=1 Tax=Solirubrum puertoriconensis TaxID=1751427 RepID=A0A9X0L3K2_SOLP1|nr:hypothetical protein [Solirubrum puertoriconensis]KUG06638.1 hypothetical protein ASU33_04660 [Solirubrum puertoriconensis]